MKVPTRKEAAVGAFPDVSFMEGEIFIMATKLVSFTKKTKLRGKNNYAYHITLGSRANRSDITTANKKDFITSNGASYSRFNTAAGNDTIYDFGGKGNFWFLGDGNDSANLAGTVGTLVDLGLGKDSLNLENAKNTTLYFSEGTKTIYSDSAEELTFDLRGATYRSEIKGKNFVVKVYDVDDEDAEIIIGTYTFKKSAARQPTIINGTNLDDFKCDENYATDEIHEEEPPSSGGMGSDVSVVEPTSSGGMGSDVSFPTFGRETDVISPDDFFCSSPAIDTIMDEQQSIVGLSQSTSLGNLGSNQNLGITFAKETAVLNPNI